MAFNDRNIKNKNRNRNLFAAAVFSATMGMSIYSFAAETTTEKAETLGNKATDSVKRTYRNAKNEICEIINGKEKCWVKKAKNKMRNAADEIETTTKETKNKVD